MQPLGQKPPSLGQQLQLPGSHTQVAVVVEHLLP
jgi:hypothetical protein